MISLDKSQFHRVKDILSTVSINHFFARSVIEQKVNGSVFVDNNIDPKTFYIVHSYGMSLLLGDHNNDSFNEAFREYSFNLKGARKSYEWMQAFPGEWTEILKNLYGERLVSSAEFSKKSNIVEFNTRLNFKFNKEKYLNFRENSNNAEVEIKRTDKLIYEQMQGSVVPKYFWKSDDDFYSNGIGFSAFCDKELASTAYSAFIHDNYLELGIETMEKFRGKGIARFACAALIDYCLENNFEPVWACRLENTASVKLAQKLGFEISAEIPYYRLSN